VNIETNRGQRLRPALQRFARGLIAEAHDLSGLAYAELDKHLAPRRVDWDGQVSRYASKAKDRAPPASAIQSLEDRVAHLLKRKARRICVHTPCGGSLGAPRPSKELRLLDAHHVSLGYEDGWPSYLDLVTRQDESDRPGDRFKSFAWQWGILWGRQDFQWLNKIGRGFGCSSGESVTILVDELVDHAEYKKAKYDWEVGPHPWMIDEKPWRHLPCPDLLGADPYCPEDIPPVLDDNGVEIPLWQLRYEAAEDHRHQELLWSDDWDILSEKSCPDHGQRNAMSLMQMLGENASHP
jgi:hypothetical protein